LQSAAARSLLTRYNAKTFRSPFNGPLSGLEICRRQRIEAQDLWGKF